jgi:hypothetical protein
LAKYAEHGFEVIVPDLERYEIDQKVRTRTQNDSLLTCIHLQIFRCPIFKLDGLARLLIFESIVGCNDMIDMNSYLNEIRENPYVRGEYKGDLRHDAGVGSVLELSDYDHGLRWVHIPYGPGWTAQGIETELLQKVRPFHEVNLPSDSQTTVLGLFSQL